MFGKYRGLWALCGSALLLMVTACHVVKLDEHGKPIIPADPSAKNDYSKQTPQQVAQAVWQDRVLAAAEAHALDWQSLQARLHDAKAENTSVFIKLDGTVNAIESSDNNPERKLQVAVNGQMLNIQIGPVIRGNAIRDAAGFKFEDFTNQVQFAQLSRELNRMAVKNLPAVDDQWLQRPVSVLAAATLSNGALHDIIALELKPAKP